MGQNIGTTLTANIAARVGNTAGKKAARAHFVFNMVGTLLTLVVLYPELNLIAYLTQWVSGQATCFDYHSLTMATIPLAITIFHTFFNVINTIILTFFIPQFIKVVDWMVPASNEDNEDEFEDEYEDEEDEYEDEDKVDEYDDDDDVKTAGGIVRAWAEEIAQVK